MLFFISPENLDALLMLRVKIMILLISNLSFYLRQFPYLDSSVIIGYKSDLLRILPQDLPELQSYLSEKFLAGSNDILVDVTGEKISTIGEKNFKLGKCSTSFRPNLYSVNVKSCLL